MEPAQAGALDRFAPWGLGIAVFLACFFSPQESPFLAAKPGAGKYYLDVQSFFDSDTNPWVFVIVAALSALAAAQVRRRRWPIYVMAVVAWLLFSLWPIPFVATYSRVLWFKRRRELVWYLIVAVVLIVLPFVVGDNFSQFPFRERVFAFGLFASITVVIPTLAGLWIRARRHRVEALVERNARLQSEQEARHQQARADERNRIARDMHDVVANRIAMIVMHAGALQLGTQKQNDVVKEATLITALGRTALTELRDVLGVLRKPTGEDCPPPTEEPLSVRLEKLTEQARDAGIPVEYRVTGKAFAGHPDAARTARERAMYRVAQEALTNVMKHASGARTVMTLIRSPDCLELTVENDPPTGPSPTPSLPSSGLGQVGLRERITVLSGQFTAEPRADGGYVVRAHVPHDGALTSQT